MNDIDWKSIVEEHELAYFRADLALSSPQSYTTEEKATICNQMAQSTAAVGAAMRADFEMLPPDARARLFDMLCASGVESREFWGHVLLGEETPLWEPPVIA